MGPFLGDAERRRRKEEGRRRRRREEEEEEEWTVVELELDTQDLLSGAAFFYSAKNLSEDTNDDFDIYLQLGESLERAGSEIYEKQIPTWKLTGKASDKDPLLQNHLF